MSRVFTYHVRDIVSIYDGDTCTLIVDLGFCISREVTVRIQGIDTPEMVGTSKSSATIVRNAAAFWISSRLDHLVLTSRELDKYGRILGDLHDSKSLESLSGYLIDQKLAHAYNGGAKLVWTAAEYAAILGLKVRQWSPAIVVK